MFLDLAKLHIRGGILILFFLFLSKTICCVYSLQAPQRGIFNEYHSICLCRETRKIFILSDEKIPYLSTPQHLYNTIVGIQSINRVSYTIVLNPNKNL